MLRKMGIREKTVTRRLCSLSVPPLPNVNISSNKDSLPNAPSEEELRPSAYWGTIRDHDTTEMRPSEPLVLIFDGQAWSFMNQEDENNLRTIQIISKIFPNVVEDNEVVMRPPVLLDS